MVKKLVLAILLMSMGIVGQGSASEDAHNAGEVHHKGVHRGGVMRRQHDSGGVRHVASKSKHRDPVGSVITDKRAEEERKASKKERMSSKEERMASKEERKAAKKQHKASKKQRMGLKVAVRRGKLLQPPPVVKEHHEKLFLPVIDEEVMTVPVEAPVVPIVPVEVLPVVEEPVEEELPLVPMVIDHAVLRFGDIVRIGTHDKDFVVVVQGSAGSRTIGRSGQVPPRFAGAQDNQWKISSFTGKNIGDPVELGDGMIFASVKNPNITFVNYIYDVNANIDAKGGAIGLPVKFGSTLDYGLLSKGEGSIKDKGWLQTYASDYHGMNWSEKSKFGNGPKGNATARVRFEFVSVPYEAELIENEYKRQLSKHADDRD